MNELLDEIEMGLKFEPHPTDPIGDCYVCGEPVYRCDDHYELDGNVICEDCLFDYMGKYLVMGDLE